MKKHIRVAAGLLFENGRLFAAKRGESPYPYLAHKYEFPGGKIEEGETGEEAVKRELKEELALDVKVGGLFGCTKFEYPDFVITLFLYECEMLSAFQLKEHESFCWMSPSELDCLQWAPADADLLESISGIFGNGKA